jgi:hypothetical protein
MNESIYLIDTNILVQWLASYLPAVQSDNQYYQAQAAIRIKQFMEQDSPAIYVPDLVWAEFLGVVLHKDIDVSGDMDDLRHWFQQRESFIQQMERLIQKQQQFFVWSREESPFRYANLLVRDPKLIDERTFQRLTRSRKAKETGKEKLLDGMDSVILMYLAALADLHPDKRVVLYTGDHRLASIVPRVRQYYPWFANNTAGEYAYQMPARSGYPQKPQ